jgi:hypothetical protein
VTEVRGPRSSVQSSWQNGMGVMESRKAKPKVLNRSESLSIWPIECYCFVSSALSGLG